MTDLNLRGHEDKVILRVAIISDKNNEQIRFCYLCQDRGYHYEAIDFQEILGRLRGHGTGETAGWILKNYNSRLHEHNQRRAVKVD